MRNLGDLFARRYGAIQWKKDVFGIDVLNLSPWLSGAASAATDLDLYDLMIQYVSQLQDAHDQYFIPSDFEAHLGFSVDIYDGKFLIDSIDRTLLAADAFPFQPGDTLVSVDGRSAADLAALFSKYLSGGNPRTVQRFAAESITDRFQAEYPRAHEIGDTATVVIQRQGGAAETYTIPWQKTGTPLTRLGPSPGPKINLSGMAPLAAAQRAPVYQQMLERLHDYSLPGRSNVLGFDELKPVFALPANFVQRLGKRSFDSFYTGTYAAADGTRIGFARIPDFVSPYLPDLDREIRYFQANTDVLVVDVMRNPGGDVCAAEDIIARLTTNTFQGSSAEERVSWLDVVGINQALADAVANDADAETIAYFQLYQAEYQDAFLNRQGRTKSLPICGSTTDRTPVSIAYTKPVLVLADEMSASSADIFAAMIQDNHVAPILGYRTMGAGGSPDEVQAGIYSEGAVTVTRSLVVRSQPVSTPDFPTTSYIENVGVRPDIQVDYMTAENLLKQGEAFVGAFTGAAVALAKGK